MSSYNPEDRLRILAEQQHKDWAKFVGLKNSTGIYLYGLKQFLIKIDEIPKEFSKEVIPPYRVMTRKERKNICMYFLKDNLKKKAKRDALFHRISRRRIHDPRNYL